MLKNVSFYCYFFKLFIQNTYVRDGALVKLPRNHNLVHSITRSRPKQYVLNCNISHIVNLIDFCEHSGSVYFPQPFRCGTSNMVLNLKPSGSRGSLLIKGVRICPNLDGRKSVDIDVSTTVQTANFTVLTKICSTRKCRQK